MTQILSGTHITDATYTLDKQTYNRLNLRAFFLRPVSMVILFIALLNLLMGMLKLMNESSITSFSILPIESNLIIGILLLVIYPLLILIRIQRGGESKAIGKPAKYSFYEDGITVQTDNTYIEHKWESLVLIEEQKDYLLIYPRKGAAYVIGKLSIEKVSYLYLKELMWKLRVPKKMQK